MPPMMSQQERESELSYAYLHAVCAAAGVGVQNASRQLDNAGIDATLHLRHDFGTPAVLTDLTIHIQLKATVADPNPDPDGRMRYDLRDVDEYERLRVAASTNHRLLAVLYLPGDKSKWLRVDPEHLAMERAAYWISLVGAPPTTNRTSQRIFLPKDNLLTPDGLIDLFRRVAEEQDLTYVP